MGHSGRRQGICQRRHYRQCLLPGHCGYGHVGGDRRRFVEITGAPVGLTYKKYVEGIALGWAQTPDDVAAFVSFLAGPDSDYMTGQAPLIDGGLVYR